MRKYIQFYDIWATVVFSLLKERLIAISLLFVLFAPVITIYLYLQFEKSAIRREIKWKMIAGMDEEELVLLKFTKEETQTKLRWEHSKEFEYDGQMYDIVSKEVKGDSIFYRVWWDHEETKLNKQLVKLVTSAMDQDEENQRNQKNLYHYFWSLFCTKTLEWKAVSFLRSELVYQDAMRASNFHSILHAPPTPPPKL